MQRYFIKNKDMLLEESDIRHIKKVMRMNINDKIEVVYNNKLHICEITSLEPFNIKVIEKLDEDKKTKIESTEVKGFRELKSYEDYKQKIVKQRK